MEIEIDKIDTDQVLKYLGYRGGPLGQDFWQDLEEGTLALKDLGPARWVKREFALDGLNLVGTSLVLAGDSSRDLLGSSYGLVLFAASLGPQVDRWILKEGLVNPSRGLIWDALASAALEGVCEEIEYRIKIEKSAQETYLTDRFSPGYGDLDIGFSKEICQILDTSRLIGLSYSTGGQLQPRKSVTALMGLSKVKQVSRFRTCQACLVKEACQFRKRGETCYGK